MVPYYKNKAPGLPQWAGGMDSFVILDQPANTSVTNLDILTGKVIVRCGKSADIDSVVAKLEGETRTRLLARSGPDNESPRPRLEYHRTVFPPPDVLEKHVRSTGKTTFTLPPGNHEYPFSFKIPFNNSCFGASLSPTLKISSAGLETSKPPPGHVRATLPPTLSGFPGEAEVRYFVKATVTRHSFWKENPRAYTPFNFIPIEPPRPPTSGNEIYARQKHDFESPSGGSAVRAKMKGIFGKKDLTDDPNSPVPSTESLGVAVDVRLPEPPILTCNGKIPLRVLMKKLNNSSGSVSLHSLQITLIGSTRVRAHELFRTEANNWMLLSNTNINVPLGSVSDASGTEVVVDNRLWQQATLPNTVAPSFKTCNIERSYQLEVRVGLNYTTPIASGKARRNSGAPTHQSTVLPFRLDAMVYSGIAPPPELLKAMEEAKAGKARTANVPANTVGDEKPAVNATEPSAARSASSQGEAAAVVATQTTGLRADGEVVPEYSDAPPSYEDAVASDLPPVAAPRPEYAPPEQGEDTVLRSDEKRSLSWH